VQSVVNFREGGRAECARHFPRRDWCGEFTLPIGPARSKCFAEPGLEGCFRAPSRPIPNSRADAAEPFFYPLARALDRCGGPWWRASSGASGPGCDANFERTKCRSGGIL